MSSRLRLRAILLGLLALCPLVAVADPPARIVAVSDYPVHKAPLFGELPRSRPRLPDIPPVPLNHYPARYTGEYWTPLNDTLVTAKRRAAAPVPFDLTYLPPHPAHEEGPTAVLAVRPCAFFDRPGGDRLASSLLYDNGALEYLKGFVGVRGMDWPAPHELDMLLCRVEMVMKGTEDETGKHGSFNAVSNSFVLRTREPFNWNRSIAQMKPPAAKEAHRGYEFHVTEVDVGDYIPARKGERVKSALFVADAHTFVIDTPTNVKALIDRLADRKPAELPAGWEKVSRGLFVAAVSNPTKAWTRFLPGAPGPRLPKGGDWEWDFLEDMDEILVALENDPTTRFTFRANARTPFAGKLLTWDVKRLLPLLKAHLADEASPAAGAVRALWSKGRFTPTFRGFEITADAGTDLLGPLLDQSTPPPRSLHRSLRTPGGRGSGPGLGGF